MSVQSPCLEEWVGVALEMEEKGRQFYERAERKTINELGRDIFRMLGADETVHIERIKVISDSLRKKKAWSEGWRELAPACSDPAGVLRGLAKKRGPDIAAGAGDLEALDVGIASEAESIKFYSDRLAATGDKLEGEFLARMIAEEKEHHRALVDMRYYLSNPADWFREAEREHLDGA